jgi:hypothetical protein
VNLTLPMLSVWLIWPDEDQYAVKLGYRYRSGARPRVGQNRGFGVGLHAPLIGAGLRLRVTASFNVRCSMTSCDHHITNGALEFRLPRSQTGRVQHVTSV